MSKNEHTGQELKTKPATKEYEEGWERIFGTKENLVKESYREEFTKSFWSEDRVDVIGKNGNDGLHYHSLCFICGKELDKVTECGWSSCPKLFEET